MSYMRAFATILSIATVCPAATIFTSADCRPDPNSSIILHIQNSGGGPGSAGAGCSANGEYNTHIITNGVSADVFTAGMFAQVTVRHGLDHFYPIDVRGSATYQSDFVVTFLGDPGFGLFTPCITAAAGGGGTANASASLAGPQVVVPGVVNPPWAGATSISRQPGLNNSTCQEGSAPGYFAFAFGQPVQFSVALSASTDTNNPLGSAALQGVATAAFLNSFRVARLSVDGSGRESYQQLTNASWELLDVSVPEPGTAGLAGLAFAGMGLAVRRLRAGRK